MFCQTAVGFASVAWTRLNIAIILPEVMQGIGVTSLAVGGFLATLSVLGNIFPEHERGKAIAVWSGVGGTATAVGPVVGGLLLAHFWWGSVFLVNAPVVVVTLVLAARWVPRSHDPASPPVEPTSPPCEWARSAPL